MSSRVRMLLQDFNNGTSLTGRAAYQELQALYQAWEKSGGIAGKGKMREQWVRVSDEHAAAHPFHVTRWLREGTAVETARPFQWLGPGFYQVQLVPVPVEKPKPPGPLPSGPKWLQALEMWTRLQGTHSTSYKFFISRDNRKHAWRKSLCNPFYQQFAWKAKKAAPAKKAKKAASGALDRVLNGDFWRDRDTENRYTVPATRTTRNAPTPAETKAPAVKPRVGIWS